MLDGLTNAVTSATGFKYGVFLALSAVAALGASFGAYAMLIRKRVLQDTPTALIRSAPQGYIELQGHAELMAGDPILAPLSMRPCVWYQFKVEEKQRNFGNSNHRSEWRTIDSGISDELFYLVDSSGRCAVDPEGAKVTASSQNVWCGNSRAPGRIKSEPGWLRFTGLSQIGQSYRYTERRIEPGDPIYALGDFTTHGGSGVVFDRSAEISDVLRQWKKNNDALLQRFDQNQDGQIDMQEWEVARQAAAGEIDASRNEIVGAPPVDVLGHARGSRNPFVIAAKTEAEMMARFHWSAVGLFTVALVSSVVLFWMISVR